MADANKRNWEERRVKGWRENELESTEYHSKTRMRSEKAPGNYVEKGTTATRQRDITKTTKG